MDIPAGYIFYCGPEFQPMILKGGRFPLEPHQVLDPPIPAFCGDVDKPPLNEDKSPGFIPAGVMIYKQAINLAKSNELNNSQIQDLIWFIGNGYDEDVDYFQDILKELGYLDSKGRYFDLSYTKNEADKKLVYNFTLDFKRKINNAKLRVLVNDNVIDNVDISNDRKMELEYTLDKGEMNFIMFKVVSSDGQKQIVSRMLNSE